ncbi:MAG: Phthiocerol synthesis polyketide synthase type I PpsC [Candidatus Heimdallarchaeota archaeon LC_2]|nr:MAG: Phthiocerol synthesis polyketide synthase type I PpsC [Candidatus Heimdallarchaeota archaeon LC_2]
MKGLEVASFGHPIDVISNKEIELPIMSSTDVSVELIASPINPSDILQIQGLYPTRKVLPSVFGSEGIAKISKIGDEVNHLNVGDTILLPLGVNTWQETLVVASKRLFPLPEYDQFQLAMIGINPPTAYAMLTEFVNLESGDWLVQNAANSAVGRYIITLAGKMGFKTVNIVRRESLITELKDLGADIVVVDGPNVLNQVKKEIGDGKIKLALDAVSGKATNDLATLLSYKGVIVSYGALSLESIQLNMGLLMSKAITLHTFWLVHWLRETSMEKIQSTYSNLITMIAQGELRAKIDQTFPLEKYQDAFLLAMKEGRNGKVLFTGPGYKE